MNNYTYRFTSDQSPEKIFDLLLTVDQWWSGIYAETIRGNSRKLNDEFSFLAGGGVHSTKQKLVELIPNKKIVWQVTESNLSFLDNPGEWENTRLVFDIVDKGGRTQITFTHEELKPQIECYEECSNAWTQYFQNLEKKVNKT